MWNPFIKLKNLLTYSIQWITQLIYLILVHWIVIYPADGAIQRLNNRSLG